LNNGISKDNLFQSIFSFFCLISPWLEQQIKEIFKYFTSSEKVDFFLVIYLNLILFFRCHTPVRSTCFAEKNIKIARKNRKKNDTFLFFRINQPKILKFKLKEKNWIYKNKLGLQKSYYGTIVTGNPKLKLKSLSIVFGWFLIFLWAFC
jgi:hypothetical protein